MAITLKKIYNYVNKEFVIFYYEFVKTKKIISANGWNIENLVNIKNDFVTFTFKLYI